MRGAAGQRRHSPAGSPGQRTAPGTDRGCGRAGLTLPEPTGPGSRSWVLGDGPALSPSARRGSTAPLRLPAPGASSAAAPGAGRDPRPPPHPGQVRSGRPRGPGRAGQGRPPRSQGLGVQQVQCSSSSLQPLRISCLPKGPGN